MHDHRLGHEGEKTDITRLVREFKDNNPTANVMRVSAAERARRRQRAKRAKLSRKGNR